MNTVTYYNTRDTPKRSLLPNKNDVFNENPDASLPKHPPSTKSQSLLRIRDAGGEGQRVNAIFRIQTHQKNQKKKKEVIFSEDLEERCSISPKKMEPEEIRLNLAKTAKKGILRRREGAVSCNNIPDRTKTPPKQQEQKIMSMALDTSILLEYDNAQKESQNKKLMNLKAVQNEPSQKTANNAKSWRTATEPEDLNDSSLSIEENSVMQEQKSSKAKLASLEKQIENVKEILKPLTGLHEPIQKWASVSEVIAAATEKIESTRQNQSSIAGSLNDLPLISTPREALNGGSKTASFNEINAKAENVKKPLGVSQSMNNLDVAGDKGSNDSKGLLKLPTINKAHASPNPSPAFLSDTKTVHQPLIKGYQSLTRHISSQSMKGIENFNPNGSHILLKPSFTANFDTGKLQTQSTTNLLGMKVHAPLSQLKAKPMFNLPDINADSNSVTVKEDNSHSKKEGLLTFCVKDTNQGVWYNVKEGTYKYLGQEYGLGLEGTAYCKLNDESIVVTGGADHQQNKVVSSKAMFVNVRKGEKEVLPGMPIARYNHAVYVSGKSLYAIGGQSFDEKILKSCYMFEVGSRNWFRIPSMQYERKNPLVCGSSNGNLYVIGGTNSEGKEVGWIEKFDHQKQVWQPVYNTLKAKFNTREAIVIGNISTSQGEEVLILVKDSRLDGGNFKYTLFAFDLENEILNKYESFQYESRGTGVQGFVNGNKLYLTEKGKWNIMDEYCLEKRIWKQRTFVKE